MLLHRRRRDPFFPIFFVANFRFFRAIGYPFLDLFPGNIGNWFAGSRIHRCCSIVIIGGTGAAARSSPFKPQQLIAATTCVTLLKIFLKIFPFLIQHFSARFGHIEPRSMFGSQFSTQNQDLKIISLTLSKKI